MTTNDMSDTLLPCPFCGEPAEVDMSRGFRALQGGKLCSGVAIYCSAQCNVELMLSREDLPEYDDDQLLDILAENWNRRASRHPPPVNEPAEWPDRLHPSHVTRISDASSYDEICINCGATDMVIGGWGELRKPCPAASIPAPERSKEETDAWIDSIMDQAIDAYHAEAGTTADWDGVKAAIKVAVSALETPPLHKEGEAVAWRWRVKGDKTWTYDPAQWFVDKNIADPTMEFERLYVAPVPVPVTITPESQLSGEILAELVRARTKFPGKNVTFAALVEEVGELATATFEEGRDRVRKEAVQVAVMAMRMVLDGDHTFDAWRESKGLDPLTAALSQKPGEQG